MIRFFYPTLLLLTYVATSGTPSWAQSETSLLLTEAAQRGPAVASVLEQPRQTPAQQLAVIFTLFDLGEPDVAALIWKSVSAEVIYKELDEQIQAQLVRKFGTAKFLSLARRGSSEQLPGARAFAESCLAAATKQGRDPKRLAKLIKDLSNDSAETRRIARNDLAVTGDPGAAACLAALARANSEQLRTDLLLTLARMRPGVEPMLIASIADGRGQFRRDVVELSGYLHLQDSVPWLAAFATGADQDPPVVSAAYAALTKMGLSLPNPTDVRTVVLSSIRQLESRQLSEQADLSWWSFDPEKNQLLAREVTPAEKHLLALGRLSNLLGELPGATAGDRRLSLIYAYEISQLLEQPLPSHYQQSAELFSQHELSETLQQAMHGGHLTAAIATAKLLGQRGDVSALQNIAERPSPLAAALAYGNRDLRFAALEAIMKISPQRSFAGASGVAPALWSFAAGAGAPQVVVASSVNGQATNWAGQLRGLDYEAIPTLTGLAALRAAFDSPRLELFLIDSDIGQPLLREVVYQLRNNNQTSKVPIAVLSSMPNLSRAKHLAEHDTRLLAIPRPHSPEALEKILAELKEYGPAAPSAETRSARALAALGWLAKLLENGSPYDELLRDRGVAGQTLYTPELSQASIKLLGVLGTADSQLLLLDYASSATLPLELRQQAAEAFRQSVERFGKLLTPKEFLRQYERYNASETADADTQQVLSQILDILEK